jgi:hypothetical protein
LLFSTPHPALRATFSRKGRREQHKRACPFFIHPIALSAPVVPVRQRQHVIPGNAGHMEANIMEFMAF